MQNNAIIRYFSGAWSELKKVSWPTRQEVVYHTFIVFVAAIIAIAITSAIDFGLTYLVELLVSSKG